MPILITSPGISSRRGARISSKATPSILAVRRILQGMRDPDVPWRHAVALVDLLDGADVELTLIKEGDHRLSAPGDLERLTATIATLVLRAR